MNQPVAASQQRPPVPLVVGSTPVARRVVDLTVGESNTDPMGAGQGDKTIGFQTHRARDLHIVLQNDAAAQVVGTLAPTYDLADGDTLTIDLDNAGPQTATFTTGNVVDIDAVTFAEVKLIVETAIPGLIVTQDGSGFLVLTSPTSGAASEIDIDAGSTALAGLGLASGVTTAADADPIDWELYLWDAASELWAKDEDFSATTAPGDVIRVVHPVLGASPAYLYTATYGPGAKANAWASGNAY